MVKIVAPSSNTQKPCLEGVFACRLPPTHRALTQRAGQGFQMRPMQSQTRHIENHGSILCKDLLVGGSKNCLVNLLKMQILG